MSATGSLTNLGLPHIKTNWSSHENESRFQGKNFIYGFPAFQGIYNIFDFPDSAQESVGIYTHLWKGGHFAMAASVAVVRLRGKLTNEHPPPSFRPSSVAAVALAVSSGGKIFAYVVLCKIDRVGSLWLATSQ